MSTMLRHDPSDPLRQTVTTFPCEVTGLPCESFKVVTLRSIMYARSPDCDTQTLSGSQRIWNPGSFAAVSTYCRIAALPRRGGRSEEHTSELQSPCNLVCRLLLEKKKYRVLEALGHHREHCVS